MFIQVLTDLVMASAFTSSTFSYHGWNLFAALHCLSCFMLFSWPFLTAWNLSLDDNILYWMGSYLFWWILAIPFFFLAVYAVAVIIRPEKSLMIGSFVIPCVTIFLLGGSLQAKVGLLSTKLRNRDCGTFPLIRKLEVSLFEAQKQHEQCLEAAIHPNVLFPSCSQYKKGLEEGENGKHWPYLQSLEANFECTGFCNPGEPLWTYHKEAGKDPCASALALFLETRVAHAAQQMMGYAILLTFVSVGWVFATKPSILLLRRENKRMKELFGPEMPEQDTWPKVNWGAFSFPWKKKQSAQEPLFYPSQSVQQAPIQVVSAPPAVFAQAVPFARSPSVQGMSAPPAVFQQAQPSISSSTAQVVTLNSSNLQSMERS